MKTKSQNKQENNIITSRGADPEFFILDLTENKIVSAIDVLKRDKHDVINLGDGTTLYYDNAMAEFTVRPAFSKNEFIQSFRDSFEKITTYLEKEFDGKYGVSIRASHVFDTEQLDNPEAQKIGCNPEFNADEVMQITPPDFSGNLRSAGGHIAIGRKDFETAGRSTLLNHESRMNMVKLMDYYVGVPFTLIDNDPTSTDRRKLYGTKSAHRPKEFGVEYRVLSNYWISSPVLVGLIYDLSQAAFEKLQSEDYQDILDLDYKLAAAAIQENNKELANEILDMIKFPKNLMIRLNQLKNVKNWDFYKEWNLAGTKIKNLA